MDRVEFLVVLVILLPPFLFWSWYSKEWSRTNVTETDSFPICDARGDSIRYWGCAGNIEGFWCKLEQILTVEDGTNGEVSCWNMILSINMILIGLKFCLYLNLTKNSLEDQDLKVELCDLKQTTLT